MTANAVVISSFSDDIHALAVAERLRQLDDDARPVLFDTVTFPITSRLDWSLSTRCSTIDFAVGRPMPLGIAARPEAGLGTLPLGEEARLSGDSIRSVWLRRPRRVSVPVEVRDSALRSYTHQTNRELLQGFIATTPAYNDPLAEGRASHRAFQLHTAQQVGLTIPDTLITSDPVSAREFVQAHWADGHDVIYKQVATETSSGPPTRLLRDCDVPRLDDLELCPAMFQQRVLGGPDLRIAVMGSAVFAAEWRREAEPVTGVDVRLESDARMWPTTLSEDLEAGVRAVHQALGLTIGVYDFKVDQDLGPCFLEVNPVGQWLDLEVDACHPVSETLARLLWHGPDAGAEATAAPFDEPALQEIQRQHQAAYVKERLATLQA